VVQRVSRMSRYYPKGIQKVAYIQWSHTRPLVQFAERTSSGSPMYVRTIDSSVCLPPEDQCLASIF
jgi:hypothetical protein